MPFPILIVKVMDSPVRARWGRGGMPPPMGLRAKLGAGSTLPSAHTAWAKATPGTTAEEGLLVRPRKGGRILGDCTVNSAARSSERQEERPRVADDPRSRELPPGRNDVQRKITTSLSL